MKDNRKTIQVLMILTIIFTVMGSTLAYWSWNTSNEQRTNVVFTVNSDFSCAADGEGNITSSDVMLAPADCTDTEYAIQRTVTVSPAIYKNDLSVYMDLWLQINSIGSGLSDSQNFRYALTTSPTSCTTGVIAKGNFYGKTNVDGNNTLQILAKTYTGTTTETYYLYIWLDKAETSSTTMNQSFDLSLNGTCANDPYIPPEEPVLDEGMIPVTISADGVATTVSKYDESWYNYENKEWANVVLVKTNASTDTGSHDRSYYLANPGTPVLESDILAYYVWIPRYKYAFPKADGNSEEISIIFETVVDEISDGSATGISYYTHPAFIWDGRPVAGIWVGKFETTGDAVTPTILPDKRSLRSQNISTQFTTSLKFSGGTLSGSKVTFTGSSTYGLTSSTDSHMMKNSEWGAVAYLSHSKYGINREIYINNSSSMYTGRSGGKVGATTTSPSAYGTYTWIGQEIESDGTKGSYTSDRTLGTNASTTGNVTGVYDMSGGLLEYVMGNYANTVGNSGFSTMPDSKYYDLYSNTQFTGDKSTNILLCTLETCAGHALHETKGWYSDFAKFVNLESPWFLRGGFSYDTGNAGIFYCSASSDLTGGAHHYAGFRSSAIVKVV